MNIRVSGAFKLATTYIRQAGVWVRAYPLAFVSGVGWRGWFRNSGSIGGVSNDTWANYNDYGNYEYIGQWRWTYGPTLASAIKFIAGSFSARMENRDDYDAWGYFVCIEGLVNGVWTRLLTSPNNLISNNSWKTVSVSGEITPVEVTRLRFGILVKHMWDNATGSCTTWEEFGTYTG